MLGFYKKISLRLILGALCMPMHANLFNWLDEFNRQNREALHRACGGKPSSQGHQPPSAGNQNDQSPLQPGDPNNPQQPAMPPLPPRKRGFAGVIGVPQEVHDLVEFMKHPEPYRRLGVDLPHGILFWGPPGTGKTSIARALAEELDAAFFATSGSSFVEIYVGQGPKHVRELFQAARWAVDPRNAHAKKVAIIFIDEIDAVAGSRGGFSGGGGGDAEYRNTVNELLNQMDGFSRSENIYVIAATNTPDHLDAAIKRPGRFDRLVCIPCPDEEARFKIIELYLKRFTRVKMSVETVREIAARSDGWSGAELEWLVKEAGVLAARAKADAVTDEHLATAFMNALDQRRARE